MAYPDQYVFRRLYVPPTDIFRSDEALLKKIVAEGNPISRNREGAAIQLDPSHAHNVVPGAHKVIWYIDKNQEKYLDWDMFLASEETHQSIDERNANHSAGNADYMSYIMVGHGRSEPPKNGEPIRRLGGLASKQFPHIHEQFVPIPKTHPRDRHIKLTEELGRRTLETQSNLAMNLTLSCIAHLLAGFGTPFEYHDTIGVGREKLHFKHQAFGFSSMSKAIKSTHNMINLPEIKRIWPEVIASVANHQSDLLPGNTRVRPGFQLNGMVLHPSTAMRERLNPTEDFDTWVLLASDGGFSMFVEDGITFDRDL